MQTDQARRIHCPLRPTFTLTPTNILKRRNMCKTPRMQGTRLKAQSIGMVQRLDGELRHPERQLKLVKIVTSIHLLS